MKKIMTVALVVLACACMQFSHARAEEKAPRAKVAILPFELNGPPNLAYLQAGVEAMLASRLGARGGMAVLDRQAVRKAVDGSGGGDPAVVGAALDADLVLKGSITGLGEMVSLDLRVLRLKGAAVDERLYATANHPGEVIGAIDQLVVDIGRVTSPGGAPPTAAEVKAAPARSAAPKTTQPAGSADGAELSLHPDRLFREPAAATPAPSPVSASGAQLPAAALPGRPELINRSQSLDLEMQDLDVGDLFGDGSQVVVVAEEHQLHCYRQERGKLVDTGKKIPAPPSFARVVAVNLADLNGNGRAELYVSTISDFKPFSYAVEWDGKAFVTLWEKQPWHIRPVNLPGRGPVLVGQQAEDDRPVREGLYILSLNGGKLVAGDKLAVPASVNLFEFAMGDFNGDGQTEVVAVDGEGVLSLYGSDGEVLWRGSENYAHSVRYIGKASGASDDKTNRNIPTRLLVADVNGDGRPELVVMKNPSGVAALLKTIGNFTGSTVEFLAWNGISFVAVWNTGEIGSYLADYQLTATPAGVPTALYLGLITKKSGLTFGEYRSVLATYPLGGAAR